ncbi:hypothetical protein [Lyngbya aestuarii]|uniref:hypothetical protein n=1 Tax=Lyngbya aestuarii TaxID=118322 RepID=UPI00403DD303
MIRKSLLASAVILGGTIAFGSAAQAADGTVILSGEVPDSCVVDATAAGTLEINVAGDTLSTDVAGGGTAGTVTFTCNAPANVTVNPALPQGNPGAYLPTATTVTVTGNLNAPIVVDAGAAAQGLIPDAGTNVLSVDMTTTMDTGLPQGNYEFDIVVTATSI